MTNDGANEYTMTPDDLWCTICNRGAEGCMHPIDEPAAIDWHSRA